MKDTWRLRQPIRFQNKLKSTTRTALFKNVGWFSTKPCHTMGQLQTSKSQVYFVVRHALK